MSDLNIFLAQANPNFKLVTVQFVTGASVKTYTYKTVLDIIAGDKVLVPVRDSEVQIAVVTETILASESELTYNFPIKWVVSKLDFTHYEKCIEQEKEANKQINKIRYKRQQAQLMEDLKSELGAEGIEQVQKLVRL